MISIDSWQTTNVKLRTIEFHFSSSQLGECLCVQSKVSLSSFTAVVIISNLVVQWSQSIDDLRLSLLRFPVQTINNTRALLNKLSPVWGWIERENSSWFSLHASFCSWQQVWSIGKYWTTSRGTRWFVAMQYIGWLLRSVFTTEKPWLPSKNRIIGTILLTQVPSCFFYSRPS